jgi:hypothetical protein
MGLTLYYDWKTKSDLRSARRAIAKFHAIAQKLPFDRVTEIYEQNPPDGQTRFRLSHFPYSEGNLYLSRTRSDGNRETVRVPAQHALFFYVDVEGAESAPIGLASHPPVVLHHEDIIE